PDVTAVCPSQLLQPLQQRPHARLCLGIVLRQVHQHPNAPDAVRLLRARRERPCDRAAEEGDERAAFHSITSSVRASSEMGGSSPRALAVLRLMTSSNLVACWTGRSPGFSPLRMRSTYDAARR